MEFKGKPLDIYDKVCEYLDKQKEDKEIIVVIANMETKEIRTTIQNSMFYGSFTEISNHLGEEIEAVKQNTFLSGCFGSRKIKLSKIECEVPLMPRTSNLTKEQGIFFIDVIMQFIEKHKIPCKYTSRELESLYNSFNS